METQVQDPPRQHHEVEIRTDNLPQFSARKLIVIGTVVLSLLVIAFFARFIPQRIHDRNLAKQADEAAGAPPVVNITLPEPMAVDSDLKLPADVRAAEWNRALVQKGLTPAGQEFLLEALTAMGCADRAGEIRSVPDLIDFDEGRIE